MLEKVIKVSVALFLTLLIIFTRSFVGIYIFGFRIGEYLVLLGVVSTIYFLFFGQKKLSLKNVNALFKFHKLLLISVIIVIIINLPNNFDNYIFKSSSYLWMISFIYFGMLLSTIFKFEKVIIYSSFLVVPIYYLQTNLLNEISIIYECDTCTNNELSNIANLILEFFTRYSDKFEPYKGSDMLIIVVSFLFLINRNKNFKFYIYLYFSFLSAIYLPFFMLKSRAAAIAFVLFLVIELIYITRKRFNIKKHICALLVFILFFILSGNYLSNKQIDFSETQYEIEQLLTSRNIFEENKPFIYLENNRINSADGNLDWRLQIWQDVIFDLHQQDKLVFGYGYNETIPAMKLDTRIGQDGLNENVHNFLINIFARGGIFNLIFFLIFKFTLIKYSFFTKENKSMLSYFIPIIFVSLFDASFENVQFPLIYYLFLGYVFSQEKDKIKL